MSQNASTRRSLAELAAPPKPAVAPSSAERPSVDPSVVTSTHPSVSPSVGPSAGPSEHDRERASTLASERASARGSAHESTQASERARKPVARVEEGLRDLLSRVVRREQLGTRIRPEVAARLDAAAAFYGRRGEGGVRAKCALVEYAVDRLLRDLDF